MSDFLSLREVRRRGNLVQWESRNDRENTGQDGSVCSIARDCHVASGQAPRNYKQAQPNCSVSLTNDYFLPPRRTTNRRQLQIHPLFLLPKGEDLGEGEPNYSASFTNE